MARQSKPKKGGKPVRQPARGPGRPSPVDAVGAAPPELREAVEGIVALARESPEGWATIAEALKTTEEVEPDVMLEFLARTLGKEVLPLLRGAALDDDEDLAAGALKALPLLGTRAAGDVLAEAYAAHPEGERAKLAWQGVQVLQARGINVSVPEPEGVRVAIPAFELRETWESVPDGVGGRELVARTQDRYGGWRAITVVWSDRAGVKDGFSLAVSRQEWTEIQERNTREGVLLAKVPPDYARWEVAWARALNAESGFPLDDNLNAWDEVVGPLAGPYTPPDPLERVRGLRPVEVEDLTHHIGCLMETRSLETWALEPADCRPWLERYRALMDRMDLAEDEETRDALDDEIAALLGEVAREKITDEMVPLFRERLLDVSRKLGWLGREHEADAAAAAVLQIDAVPREQVLFFHELANSGLSLLEEILEDGEDPEALRYDPMQPIEESEELEALK